MATKVLIIGGTGLISTSITQYLVERNVDVFHYNRGKAPRRVEGKITHIQGDRTEYATFERQMSELDRFDCVIDMVGFKPEEAESIVRVFRGRTEQVIFCSTVDVYSKQASRYPIVEDEKREPNSSYGENKARSEDIHLAANERGDYAITMIRPAHTYGDQGGVFNPLGGGTRYLDRLYKGKPIVVHGDGTSMWVSCHTLDVGRAFAMAVGNSQAYGKAYHVTGEEWMTWNQYHQKVAHAIGAPEPRLVHIPTDVLGKIAPKRAKTCVWNFQNSIVFDNTAAQRDLDFAYTIRWEEGVRRHLAWLEQHGNIENSDTDTFDDRIIAVWERHVEQIVKELDGVDQL